MPDSTTYAPILTRGTKSQLPSASDGKIRFVTDTQQLFIDYGNAHIEIADYVKGYTSTQILNNISSPLDKIYLASDTHQSYYYDTTNSTWINLSTNHTHPASSITGLGDLAEVDFITIENVDTTAGLDFGDEDADEEET